MLLALLLPVLLRLGFWQLERAQEKRDLQQMFEARSALPPLPAEQLVAADAGELAFRRVRLHGRYDNEHQFLLDNQIANGHVGYHVLTPLVSGSGQYFIVNRGWVAGHADRSLPQVPELSGPQELLASVYVPQGDGVLAGADNWASTWPTVVQQADMAKISQKLGATLFPYVLRIEPGEPGAQRVYWPAINTRPAKHTGYAVQWFLMSLALLICALFASLEKVPAKQA